MSKMGTGYIKIIALNRRVQMLIGVWLLLAACTSQPDPLPTLAVLPTSPGDPTGIATPISAAAAVSPTGAATLTHTATATATVTPSPTPTGTPTITATPTATPSPTLTPRPTETLSLPDPDIASVWYVQSGQTAPVHTCPDVTCDIIGEMGEADPLRVVRREGDWLLIRLPQGGEAYIQAQFAYALVPSDTPVPQVAPPIVENADPSRNPFQTPTLPPPPTQAPATAPPVTQVIYFTPTPPGADQPLPTNTPDDGLPPNGNTSGQTAMGRER